MKTIRELWNEESGASMAEYALLLALIAVGTIGAVTVLRNQIVGIFDRTGSALEGAE